MASWCVIKAWQVGALLCFPLLSQAVPNLTSPLSGPALQKLLVLYWDWLNPKIQAKHPIALGCELGEGRGMREMKTHICFPSASLYFNFQIFVCNEKWFTLVWTILGDIRWFLAFRSPHFLTFFWHCSFSNFEEDIWVFRTMTLLPGEWS